MLFVGVTLCLLLAARKRHQVLYPYNPHFISPATGKPIPLLESWITRLLYESSDRSIVYIPLGDQSNDVNQTVLAYLSPLIRTRPDVQIFEMYWDSYTLSRQSCFRIVDNRSSGVFSHTDQCGSNAPVEVLGRGLTDRDIHEAGAAQEVYSSWAYDHWKR